MMSIPDIFYVVIWAGRKPKLSGKRWQKIFLKTFFWFTNRNHAWNWDFFLKIKREKRGEIRNLREPKDWLKIIVFFCQYLSTWIDEPDKTRFYSFENSERNSFFLFVLPGHAGRVILCHDFGFCHEILGRPEFIRAKWDAYAMFTVSITEWWYLHEFKFTLTTLMR